MACPRYTRPFVATEIPEVLMALASGTRVGIYEVTAKIGEGGMGEVYQARDTTR